MSLDRKTWNCAVVGVWMSRCWYVSGSYAIWQFHPSFLCEALLQKKNKMLEEALQLALKAQEKVWILEVSGSQVQETWTKYENGVWFFLSCFIDFVLVPWNNSHEQLECPMVNSTYARFHRLGGETFVGIEREDWSATDAERLPGHVPRLGSRFSWASMRIWPHGFLSVTSATNFQQVVPQEQWARVCYFCGFQFFLHVFHMDFGTDFSSKSGQFLEGFSFPAAGVTRP